MMGLDASVVAMIEQVSTMPPDDPAPPLMTDDSARGAARLSELMVVEETPAVGAVAQPPPAANMDGAALNRGTLGDEILDKLGHIGQRYQNVVNDAHDAVANMKSPNLQDLLGIQLKLITVALEVETISKGVGKATQHLDQLTKLQ